MVTETLRHVGCILVACYVACASAPSAALQEDPVAQSPVPSSTEIRNLFLLGKVWGYLKYHHPDVSRGCFDWDSVMLRVAEKVASIPTHEAAQAEIAAWVTGLGGNHSDCSIDTTNTRHFSVRKDWIADAVFLSDALRAALGSVESESRRARHRYVGLATGVGNPYFIEEPYSDAAPLDWRYRLLSLFRYWNIIEYWFPYRNLISTDWDAVLLEFIPRFLGAKDEKQYVLELMALIARVEDGHANLYTNSEARPPGGTRHIAADIRYVEGNFLVWRVHDTDERKQSVATDENHLQYGDIVLAVDGRAVEDLANASSSYYGASNLVALQRQIARNLLRGSKQEVVVTVDRDGVVEDLTLMRTSDNAARRHSHDRDGETLQILLDDVAYLKLSSIDAERIDEYVNEVAGLKGLIIDIRNYPSSFVVFAIGAHLVNADTPFARFTIGDLNAPGTFRYTDPISLEPRAPQVGGKVIILVDETSQSQAEYTAMAFRAAPSAVVIGTQTAGADGNVSRIDLPGGYTTGISGIGVFYPDKTPTQKIGIVPDIEIRPTIDGLRSGRDEILERAVKEILGDSVTEEKILAATRIPHAPR